MESRVVVRRARKRRRRLNRLGKLTLSFLILLTASITYVIVEHLAEGKAEATKNIDEKIDSYQSSENLSNDDEELVGSSEQQLEKQQEEQPELPSTITDERNEIEDIQENETEEPVTEIDQSLDQESSNNTIDPLETGKVVYLTFDDGPHPTASAQILEVLKKYNAKATYFLLEPYIKSNPDIVQQMMDEGHALGVHGVTHEVSKVYRSPQSFVGEMKQAAEAIRNITGSETRLIRAPYGSKPYVTSSFKNASDQANFLLWDWNVDSVDWKYTNGEYVNHVIDQVNRLVGKEPLIVLLHEKPSTAAHLEKLLIYFQNNGYEMKALNETMPPIQLK